MTLQARCKSNLIILHSKAEVIVNSSGSKMTMGEETDSAYQVRKRYDDNWVVTASEAIQNVMYQEQNRPKLPWFSGGSSLLFKGVLQSVTAFVLIPGELEGIFFH